jgi:nucleotide-binding universal stress UspA family protein
VDFTVLIPLDGSRQAEAVLPLIASLKALGTLKVRLLSVVEPEDVALPSGAAEEVRAQYLDDLRERLSGTPGVLVNRICHTGEPYVTILDEASRADVDLVVMASHGSTAAKGDHLGSVADKVVRGISGPLLLLGPHATAPASVGSITVPLDGSALSAEALPVAKRFARALGAHVRLVRCVDFPETLDTDLVDGLVKDPGDRMYAEAQQYLANAGEGLGASLGETAVLSGRAVPALQQDFEAFPPDLVVMTSHGQTGYIPWALGSVTDRVIRGAVPVLLLRPTEVSGSDISAGRA